MLLVGVEAVGRLVEDHDVGVVQERLGQADPALEALGQGVDRPVEHAVEMCRLDGMGDALGALGAVEAAHGGDEFEKAGRGHVGIGRRALGQIADVLLGLDRLVDHVEAADLGAAAGRRQVAGDDLHGRRLAGAVGPEEAQDLAALDGKAHAVDGADRSETLGYGGNLDHFFRVQCGEIESAAKG